LSNQEKNFVCIEILLWFLDYWHREASDRGQQPNRGEENPPSHTTHRAAPQWAVPQRDLDFFNTEALMSRADYTIKRR
jgi:hypothetical protein